MKTSDDMTPAIDPRIDFFNTLADGWDDSEDRIAKKNARRDGTTRRAAWSCVRRVRAWRSAAAPAS